jgi:hypothetical protein
VQALREEALAQMQLAPHVKDPSAIPTPESVEQELRDWIDREPAPLGENTDEYDLHDLLMGGRHGS